MNIIVSFYGMGYINIYILWTLYVRLLKEAYACIDDDCLMLLFVYYEITDKSTSVESDLRKK